MDFLSLFYLKYTVQFVCGLVCSLLKAQHAIKGAFVARKWHEDMKSYKYLKGALKSYRYAI